MGTQPFVNHKPGVIVSLVFSKYLLYAGFTRLPVILHVFHTPVGTGPDNNIIDHTIWAIVNVGKIRRKLAAIIYISRKFYFISKIIAGTQVKISCVHIHVGNNCLLISMPDTKPDIVFIATGGNRYMIGRKDTGIKKSFQIIFSTGNPGSRFYISGKCLSISKGGSIAGTGCYFPIILR